MLSRSLCTVKVTAGEMIDVLSFHDKKLDEEIERFEQVCDQYTIDNPKEKRHWFFWKKRLSPQEILNDGCDFISSIFDGHADKLISCGYIKRKDYLTLSVFWNNDGRQISLWFDEVKELRYLLSALENDNHDRLVTINSAVARFVGVMKKAMYSEGEYQ